MIIETFYLIYSYMHVSIKLIVSDKFPNKRTHFVQKNNLNISPFSNHKLNSNPNSNCNSNPKPTQFLTLTVFLKM